MDALAAPTPSGLKELFGSERPSRAEAEQAVRTLIRWAGDDPRREGLVETPSRVVRAYREWFAGYDDHPAEQLLRTFKEAGACDEPVTLRHIPFRSCCEHHMAPITGVAHISYLPCRRVVGISKLVRVVDCFARRLQIQERMTTEIAELIQVVLQPRGVAVMLEGSHGCMSSRGVNKHGVSMVTTRMLGAFSQDPGLRREFLDSIE
jgi:GTP cyclohydrolase I